MKALVRLQVVGYNLDQLINKLYSMGITCYNITRSESNVIFFSIRFKDLNKVKPLLTNYEYHVKYLGITNFKTWFIKNLAVILVIPFAIGLMAFSTRFTWDIRIYGVEDRLQAEVVNILKANDVAVGKAVVKSSDEIESILLEQIPSIAQVSCVKRGTTLIINVSEKLVYTPERYEPICAKFNGVVTNFSLISGTMAVSIGDFVEVGDILVYPFTLDKNGEQVQVEPIAEVRARAYVVGSLKLDHSGVVLSRTGRQYTTSCITFLNKNLFSKKLPKPFDLYETNVYNEYISSVLPILRTTITYYELDYIVVERDLVAEKPMLEQESIDLAYKNLPTNSEILDQQTSSIIINDCLYSTTTLTISTIIS